MPAAIKCKTRNDKASDRVKNLTKPMTTKKRPPKKTVADTPSETTAWDFSKPPSEQNNAQGAELRKSNAQNTSVKVPEADLGFRIRLLREKKGLTQEALSILTKYPEIDPEGKGLSRPSIVGYEQGKNLPDARGIRLLATALEVTPSWLVLGKYDDPAEPEDPRKALMAALDRYTARRSYELEPTTQWLESITSGQTTQEKKLEVLDPVIRMGLEKKASEEALAKNQEIHKQRANK